MKNILLLSIALAGLALGQGNGVNSKGQGISDIPAFRTALTLGTGDSPTFTGINLSGQTASTIVGFDASKNVISLSTATYPSLTELSYVKGLSSALQTQLNAKAPTASPTFTGTLTAVGSEFSGNMGFVNTGGSIINNFNVSAGGGAGFTFQEVGSNVAQFVISGGQSYWDYRGNIYFRAGYGGATSLTLHSSGVLETSGNIELGHASDTTLSRSAAGKLAVEGVDVVSTAGNQTIAGNKTLSGQTELTGQAATNSTSAMTRGLSDERFAPKIVDGSNLISETTQSGNTMRRYRYSLAMDTATLGGWNTITNMHSASELVGRMTVIGKFGGQGFSVDNNYVPYLGKETRVNFVCDVLIYTAGTGGVTTTTITGTPTTTIGQVITGSLGSQLTAETAYAGGGFFGFTDIAVQAPSVGEVFTCTGGTFTVGANPSDYKLAADNGNAANTLVLLPGKGIFAPAAFPNYGLITVYGFEF